MKYIDILKGINKEWSIKEKARYIYENIGKNISYDERFAYSQNKDLLHAIYDREVDIRKEEDARFICHTANKIYKQLLSEENIRCKLIYKKAGVNRPIEVNDVALIFWDEDGNKYYTNIVGDIENCKFGLRTVFFGITDNLYEEAQDVKEIPNDELKEIDIKTGTIKTDYNDIVFELLRNEVKNTNNFKKFLKGEGIDADNLSSDDILKNKMQYLNRLVKFRDKTAGPDEMKKFYKHLFSASVLDKFESKKFKAYEYAKEEGEKVDTLSVLELNLLDFPVYYIYSDEEETYIQMLPDEILEKIDGYHERRNRKLIIETELKSDPNQDDAR